MTPNLKRSGKNSWKKLSIEDRDRLAWEAICRWPNHTSVDVVHSGHNFATLTNWFLWDKVGRAVRKSLDSEGFAFEKKLLDYKEHYKTVSSQPLNPEPGFKKTKVPRLLKNNFKFLIDITRIKKSTLFRRAPVIFMPHASWQLEDLATVLIQTRSALIIANSSLKGFAGAYPTPVPPNIKKADFEFGKTLHSGILEGLSAFDVELYEKDSVMLYHQIQGLSVHLKLAEAEIRTIVPGGVVILGDKLQPYQNYVSVSKCENIPSIMIQRGLDCDRYYYDDAYTDFIAVWGSDRLQRYQKDSTSQPKYIEVTGNPRYSNLMWPNSLNTKGQYWLWVTRSHDPERCYAPSRRPEEGLSILKALLEVLAETPSTTLVIKPHPSDFKSIYRNMTAKSPAANQVKISDADLQNLIPGANLIFTEDTTAGMEAMFWGKPIIHIHFALSPPVIPFVEYGSALPGFSIESLKESIILINQLTRAEKDAMLYGQRNFLKDHAGVCDGKAAERLVGFVIRTLSMK